ncbi:hypothetical protein [Pragia fontium]|uniref:hypothetical protein n=1 Tax=Pragia fontium TaxID=82985 RepID=UPI0006497D54|nr:hypothetical protein [Pragia fontium]AKJ41524.1 hypothetical protein QQ39_05040 [Pragia fontium]
MENQSLLIKRRSNYINSVFDYLRKKNKSTSYIRIVDDSKYQIDLDKTVLANALEHLYENNICKEIAGLSDREIISTYAALYTTNGNLTKEGKEFFSYVTELIAERLHRKAMENE